MQLTRSTRASRGLRVPRLAFVTVVTVLAFRSPPAAAANPVWNNNTGDSLWSTGGNWSTGSAPGSLDTATFSGSTTTCSVTGNVSVAAVTISVPVTINVSSGVTVTTTGNFSQSAGTFNGGNSKMRVGGSFSLSGGTFKSTSGRLEIGGGFSKTGGTFTHNSGQVMLNASSGSQTFASGGATFYDLTINDGLVGYWKLDEGSGSAAADSSGYGNNGTLGNSPTWITSGLPALNFTDAAGLSFNGSTNYVSLGTTNLPAVNGAQTISLWAKLNSTGSGQQNLIALTNQSSAGVQIEVNGSNFGAYNWGAGTLVATTAPSTGTWHHVAYTYDGASHQTLYIDGTATTATVTNQSGSESSAYLGTYSPNNQMFNGSLDDVRIYNRALSASEISSLARGYQPATYAATQTLTGSPAVSDDLTIASGSLVMGANTISLGADFWNYGGLLSATYWNGAAINFTGSATSNVIRSGGQFLPSLNFTGTGTWTLADNLDVDPNDTVTMTTGSLNLSARTLRTGALAAGSGTLTTTGATVILDGNSNSTLSVTPQNILKVEDPSESNLVGYWKLDQSQGSSARDWTGNGHTATLMNGATWTTTVPSTIEFYNPAALSLASSSSQYADAGTSVLSTNAAFTACSWVDFTSVSGWDAIVSFNGTNVAVFTLQRDNAGQFSVDMRSTDSTSATLYHVIGSTTVATGTWYHVCGIFDGSKAHVYVNGSEEGTAATVSSTWNASGDLTIGANVYSAAMTDYSNGLFDDVRVYNVALTAAQIKQLAKGRYANTGGISTVTLGASVTAGGAVNVDSGALDPGAYTLTASGGLTVGNAGTLTLDTANGTVALGSGTTLTIDGTLNASVSSATLKSSSGSYTFKVGSSSTATPTVNVTGLKVQNTDASGLQINANTSASTTLTNFNNIAFSSGTSGGTLLHIYASSLSLISDGCTFDASTTYTVTLVGDGFTAGSDSTETRAVFGGATCSAGSCQSTKSDDDSNNDGVPTASSGGAVVQFISNAPTDTAGTIQGFPTAAFSWNDGSYYSTYVAFNNTSSNVATVYVRDSTGAAKYSWSPSGSATIVGTPRWTTEGSSGSEKHYLYVALSSGKVYRLLDSGSSLAADTTSTGWSSSNPYDCACTISTPIAIDATNLYWAGQKTSDSSYRIWAVGQTNQSVPGWSPMRPSSVSSPTTSETAVTSASLAIWTSGSSYAFLGQTGYIVKANVSTGTVAEYNSNPGSGKSILGRIIVVSSGTNRVLAGDDGGNFWSIDPATFSGTNKQWNYSGLAGTDQIKSTPLYDYTGGYVQFGTEGGRLVVLNASSGAALTGYPMTSLTTDPMRAAILYRSGVVAVGTTTGRLFFVNRRTTSGGTPVLMREYYFGSTEQVSGIAYDSNSGKYLVSTSSSSANDGRLYTIDATDSVLTDTDGIL